MKGIRDIGDRITEILILLLILASIFLVIFGIYGPQVSRSGSGLWLVLVLIAIFLILFLKGSLNPLMARLGIRNLIRHKGDSMIAIIGFMVGTSIICSSLVIGDTMTSLVESLIYENYHTVDEVLYLRDTTGNRTIIDGTTADEVELRIRSIEDSEELIDGISWEIDIDVSIVNPRTGLVEPSLTLRSFSEDTTAPLGYLLEDGSRLPQPSPGSIFMTENAADLVNAEPGDIINISYDGRTTQLLFETVVDQTGRANLFGGENLYVSFETAWSIMNLTPEENDDIGPGNWQGGFYNTLFVSNTGDRVEGGELCDTVTPRIDEALEDLNIPPGSDRTLSVVFDKDTGVDQAMEAISTFIKLFVTLAAFSIIAGVTLIINIFVMLSEERRGEMGISRAIGLRRSHLRSSYLFEGALYSLLSSLVGVIVGLGAAYGIIYLLEGLIAGYTDVEIEVLKYFSVVPLTLLLSFGAGFSITLGTTWLITQRIANLNIVSAIKSIPPPKVHTVSQKLIQNYQRKCMLREGRFYCNLARSLEFLLDRLLVWGALMILAGLVTGAAGMYFKQVAPVQIGLSFLVIGAGLLLRYKLPDRHVYTVVSFIILILWSVELDIYEGLDSGLEMFLFSGIFMVTSGVMIVVWNTDVILFLITSFFRLLGVSAAPIKMAISYPMKKRFRTGVTIFMFALIIFTVTGTSMVVHIFNINISEFERSVGGGYDIIGISNGGPISDLRFTVEETWGSNNSESINWEDTTSLSVGYAEINLSLPFGNELEIPYIICGVTEEFKSFNTYGFSDVAWDILKERGFTGKGDIDVWNSLSDPDLIIVDSTLGENNFGPPGLGKRAGDMIKIDLDNGTTVRRTIAAITDQFAIQAIFTNEDIAASDYNTTQKTLHMIKVREGQSISEVSDGLRRSLIEYGFFSFEVKKVVKEVLTFQRSFFDLFNAYLSMGLIIGIVGLGIVTLRSVYERRHEIGMMRAIGFKRRAVLISFLGESTFIALSGIVLGSIMGVILGWNLWRDEVSSDLPIFGIPYGRLLIVGSIALAFALLSCIPPSRMATKVSPAEALRYE